MSRDTSQQAVSIGFLFFFTGNKTNEFKHSFLLLLEDATAMRSLHLEKLQLYKEKKIFALTVQDLKSTFCSV